jgi:hypothetical protein
LQTMIPAGKFVACSNVNPYSMRHAGALWLSMSK